MNAVITGATKGIGLAVSKVFAENGINLCVCSRNEAELDSMRQSFQTEYPDLSFYSQACDVSQKSEVLNFANYCTEVFEGKIDVLVNNAGIYIGGEIENEEDGALEQMIDTNLYSAYHLTRAILPNMISQKDGHVINMCSIASQIAYPNGGSYSISKFALLGFTKVLREEMKEKGIRVTAILPGATWSNSWAGVELPRERLMEAYDIAQVVYTAVKLGKSAVMEDVVIRPQLGDL